MTWTTTVEVHYRCWDCFMDTVSPVQSFEAVMSSDGGVHIENIIAAKQALLSDSAAQAWLARHEGCEVKFMSRCIDGVMPRSWITGAP